MQKQKIIYYKDVENDDFADNKIHTRPLPDDYRYKKTNPIWRACAFFLYYFIAFPVANLYNFFGHGEIVKNKRVLRKYKKNGFFAYGNHTMKAADAFTPSRISFPKKAYIVVGADAMSIPVVSSLVEMLGGVPVGTDIKGMKNFMSAIDEYAKLDKTVFIYPEAHIWPYCNFIRPFKDSSFYYPAKTDKPVFCFTRVFKKRLFFKKPKSIIYVDGPFLPKQEFTARQNQKYLRDLVYNAMVKRSKLGNAEYVKYVYSDTDAFNA